MKDEIKPSPEEIERTNRQFNSKVQPVRLYVPEFGAQAGIGFYDRKLTEYHYSLVAPVTFAEVTPLESVEWMERMIYAQARTGMLMQADEIGELKWLRLLQEALQSIVRINVRA